jgi:hypothetical protein
VKASRYASAVGQAPAAQFVEVEAGEVAEAVHADPPVVAEQHVVHVEDE